MSRCADLDELWTTIEVVSINLQLAKIEDALKVN